MYTRILKMRGKKIDINDRDHLGFTPLHWAIDIGNNILIEKLLKYGAGVNETDNNKSNFLHEAIKQDNLLAVQLLLQYKAADVNIVDNNGNSFCHLGASIDNLEILKNLIQYIPEESRKNILNQINTEGEMLIHLATKKGYKSVVEILLQNEADVNATTQDGCTPLYLAAGSGNLEIVNLLLKHGADIHKKTKNNDTPLQVADRLGYRLVVEILIQKAVKIALIKDTDINAVVDTNGNTLFHWAVNYGDLKSVRALLLSKKLNKNQKNNLEQTASDLESINNYEAITKLLKNNNLFDKSKDFFQRTFSLK
ncbi:ankyrin repeat domain-containing protein [Cardinium endosymbiont of Culicoides punctatus]|uniref:ankyrin repeat domain-containing protein n=1 Tax=Cardinium endosymbiont of Culicoides punctatus TaxID=2304601 RepID=UPI001058DE7B